MPWALLCVLCAFAVCAPVAQPSGRPVRAVVLGIAQDGGVPHIGCTQERCVSARRDPSRRQRVACLGRIVARPTRPLEGILLTHAHIGHYAGLMYLGREALGARGVPVYATARMAQFLRENGPWRQLVALGNIELREMEPGREVVLSSALRVTPLRVPHRDEFSDTVGFRVRGPARSLLYIPDVDKWERWDRRLVDEVAGVDAAFLDGTFDEATELGGARASEVPHPLVGETLGLLPAPGLRERVFFIHLNHTNRLLDLEDARRGQGARVARDGQELPL